MNKAYMYSTSKRLCSIVTVVGVRCWTVCNSRSTAIVGNWVDTVFGDDRLTLLLVRTRNCPTCIIAVC